MKEYDVVIIGGGLAYTGAYLLRNAGLKVAVVEKEEKNIGGVCLNKGCVPTKLYIKEAKTLYQAKHSKVASFNLQVNLKNLYAYKEELTARLRQDILKMLKGVDVYFGYGELIEPYTVKVDKEILKAKHVIINTGKRQAESQEGFLTSDDLLNLQEVPKSLSLKGNDPILYEFACMFSVFGSQVSIFTEGKDLDFMHPSIKSRFLKMIKALGVNEKKESEFEKSELNVLFEKRVPNSEAVKLQDIQKDKEGHIIVDENFETSLKNHYAVGDVNGLFELAHAARIQSLIVANRILGKEKLFVNFKNIPYVLYTLPMSYAKVGITHYELKSKVIQYQEKLISFRPYAIGSIQNTEDGLVILYFDKRNFLIGAEVLSAMAEEVIGSVTCMLNAELDLKFISQMVLPHPTVSEVLVLGL